MTNPSKPTHSPAAAVRTALALAVVAALHLVPAAAGLPGSSAQAQAPAPTPPPATPAEPSSTTSPALTCEPDCRIGFTCVEGRCVSQCNPACGPGLYCTEQRMCALVPTLPSDEPPVRRRRAPADPETLQAREDAAQRVQLRLQARQRARAAREVRLGLRQTPRLTVAVAAGYQQLAERTEVDSYQRHAGTTGGAISVGLRKNFHALFGVHADVTTVLGKARISDRDGQLRDDTFAFGLGVGGGAYFSTPWRLYFGPVAQVEFRHFGKDTLTMFGRPYALNPDGPIHANLGGEVGFLLLDQEQLDLSLQVTAGLPEKMPQFFLSARFHLLPQSL